jgi:hypothetical protein
LRSDSFVDMTTSLKATLPVLGRLIGISPNVLYERQKVLMQEGVLTTIAGRGPGSGVVATPESLALLLIAFLANPLKLSDLAETTRRIASAAPTVGKKCPFTGASVFGDALAKVLSNRRLLERVTRVQISGSHSHAEIHFRNSRKVEISAFDGHKIENPGRRFDFSLLLNGIPDFDQAIADLLDDSADTARS